MLSYYSAGNTNDFRVRRAEIAVVTQFEPRHTRLQRLDAAAWRDFAAEPLISNSAATPRLSSH